MNFSVAGRVSVQGAPLALGLFLPTVYPSSGFFWLPVFALWAANSAKLRFYREDKLLIGFLLGVVILTLLGAMPQLTGGRPWSPAPFGYLLLPVCVLIGRWLNAKTVRWLLAFICVEAAICGIQMAVGQPYVFAGQRESILNAGVTEWGSSDLLYFNRTYGLSTNSSVAAQKFMIGVLLLFEGIVRRHWRVWAMLLLGIGLYGTFNRTALISIALFLGLKATRALLRVSSKRQLLALAVAAGTAIFLAAKWPELQEQFLRGNLDSSLAQDSGRGSLWAAAAQTISAHPVVGNFSQRFEILEYGEWYHLHSSWLQVLADHGIVGLLLIAHAVSLVRPHNAAAFLAFAFYSFVQFGLFGKFSLINIVFYYMMRHRRMRTSRHSSSTERALSPSLGDAEAPISSA